MASLARAKALAWRSEAGKDPSRKRLQNPVFRNLVDLGGGVMNHVNPFPLPNGVVAALGSLGLPELSLSTSQMLACEGLSLAQINVHDGFLFSSYCVRDMRHLFETTPHVESCGCTTCWLMRYPKRQAD